MNNLRVVEFRPEGSPNCVARLRKLLRLAKRGQIIGLYCAWETVNGDSSSSLTGDSVGTYAKVIGQAHIGLAKLSSEIRIEHQTRAKPRKPT